MTLQIKAKRFYVVKLILDSIEQIDIGEKQFTFSLFNEKINDNELSVVFDLKLKFLDVNKSLHLMYAVDFEVRDSDDEEFVVSEETREHPFLMVNAPAIGFPFVRSFVSTLSINAGYSPIILPAINFQELYNRKKAAKTEPKTKVISKAKSAKSAKSIKSIKSTLNAE
ncbi:protein-export chaperone SecB [Undibacterium sp. Di24W]|uniref:protein-export chaperone SecB n=1 Tax=Undibacterium sp. Di24W TaxID=3413033 RepID=UPI003BF45B60